MLTIKLLKNRQNCPQNDLWEILSPPIEFEVQDGIEKDVILQDKDELNKKVDNIDIPDKLIDVSQINKVDLNSKQPEPDSSDANA